MHTTRWPRRALAVVAVAIATSVSAGCASRQAVDAGAQGGAAAGGGTTVVGAVPVTSTTSVTGTTEPPSTTAVPSTKPPPTPTEPSPTEPPTTSPPASPAPAPGDRHPAGWESYTVSVDGRTLTFIYYAGVEPCSMFDGVVADEQAGQVTVTIYERSGADPHVVCIAIAQEKSATVTLHAPLGGRTVVDGAR